MKKILLRTILALNLLFIFNCKSQTTLDEYITFYNGVSSKLNLIVPNKSNLLTKIFLNFIMN